MNLPAHAMWVWVKPSDSEYYSMSHNTIPAELAEIIATHRALFGGWTMVEGDEGGSADDAGGDNPGDGDEKLKEPGLKALQAERDARAAAEARAAALEKEIADSKLSAEEKASAELKAAQETAAKATLAALQYEVAAAAGIDIKLAPRLTGATKAELEADAETLKALIPTGTKPGTPAADRSQGKGGDAGKVAGVSAGRDLFRDSRKTQTQTTTS